jgi:hypothetical protein
MIFAKCAALFLLFVLAMSDPHSRAQNQTPANVAPVVPVTWTDTATGLMWTKADNGSNMDWNQAIAYCTNLHLGGYSDWRLPAIDELEGIYDPGIDVPGLERYKNGEVIIEHVKGNLKLSGWHWSSTQKNSGHAWFLTFSSTNRVKDDFPLGLSNNGRALCVRR